MVWIFVKLEAGFLDDVTLLNKLKNLAPYTSSTAQLDDDVNDASFEIHFLREQVHKCYLRDS